MYVGSTYNYFHDFRSFLKYATIQIEIVIENGRSLKLRQTWLNMFAFMLPPTQSTPNARPLGHYLTYSWVSGRVR